MATTQQQVKEDPAALLQRTNLAEYLRARKALAAQAAQQGAPTRPVLPFLLRTDHSVQEALLSFSTLRVQSAPLVQVHADGQHYTAQCFLSIGDLVTAFIERANATGRCGGDLHVLERIGGLTAAGQAFSEEHLHAMRSRWDGTGVWQAATEQMTLADALKQCMRIGEQSPGAFGLRYCPHRFAVIDTNGLVTDIVAQSDIAMYLWTNRAILNDTVLQASVGGLKLGTQGRAVCVPAGLPVFDCFVEMERQGVMAVAVVDDATEGVIGSLSETDLLGFTADSFGALALPVGEYLIHAHHLTPFVPADRDRMDAAGMVNPNSTAYAVALAAHADALAVTCTRDSVVAEVLDKMHTRAVHRVWVIDDARRPVGVIALADILALVSPEYLSKTVVGSNSATSTQQAMMGTSGGGSVGTTASA